MVINDLFITLIRCKVPQIVEGKSFIVPPSARFVVVGDAIALPKSHRFDSWKGR
jgi:hypothetical protein